MKEQAFTGFTFRVLSLVIVSIFKSIMLNKNIQFLLLHWLFHCLRHSYANLLKVTEIQKILHIDAIMKDISQTITTILVWITIIASRWRMTGFTQPILVTMVLFSTS